VGFILEYIFFRQLRQEARALQNGLNSANAALAYISGRTDSDEVAFSQREALLRRAIAGIRASILMRDVDVYLDHLEATGQWQFSDANQKAEFSRKLKFRIRPVIISEVEANPETSDAQLRKRIEQLVDIDLDIAKRQ
jgi:hypothetical protein